MAVNPKAVRQNLFRKLASHWGGIDPSTQTQPVDLGLGHNVVVTNSKLFPLHSVIDDPYGVGSGSGGVITVGDSSNPEDNYTRTFKNIVYTGTPGAGTDTDIYEVTAGKTLYVYAMTLLKTTAENMTFKDGTGGTTRFITRPAAISAQNVNFGNACLVFTDDLTVNQPTSEAALAYNFVGWEQ